MFSRYNDWDIAFTPSGLVKRRIQQALGYAVLATMIGGVMTANVSDIGLVGLARGALSTLMTFVEYGAVHCREKLDQRFQS